MDVMAAAPPDAHPLVLAAGALIAVCGALIFARAALQGRVSWADGRGARWERFLLVGKAVVLAYLSVHWLGMLRIVLEGDALLVDTGAIPNERRATILFVAFVVARRIAHPRTKIWLLISDAWAQEDKEEDHD